MYAEETTIGVPIFQGKSSLKNVSQKVEILKRDVKMTVVGSTMEKPTRIPAHLWESLQDAFYEHDQSFLRILAPHVKVSYADLKRTLLGARGQLMNIQIADSDKWWEAELCPLRIRTPAGIWKSCGHSREAHGVCRHHVGFTPRIDLKHKDDPWFQTVTQRKPWKYQREIVWVAEDGSVINEQGDTLPLQICPKTGFLISAAHT